MATITTQKFNSYDAKPLVSKRRVLCMKVLWPVLLICATQILSAETTGSTMTSALSSQNLVTAENPPITRDDTENPEDSIQTLAWLKGFLPVFEQLLGQLLDTARRVRAKTTPYLQYQTKETTTMATFVGDILNQAMNTYDTSIQLLHVMTDKLAQTTAMIPTQTELNDLAQAKESVVEVLNKLYLLERQLIQTPK